MAVLAADACPDSARFARVLIFGVSSVSLIIDCCPGLAIAAAARLDDNWDPDRGCFCKYLSRDY
jgi:hypothetical protein